MSISGYVPDSLTSHESEIAEESKTTLFTRNFRILIFSQPKFLRPNLFPLKIVFKYRTLLLIIILRAKSLSALQT